MCDCYFPLCEVCAKPLPVHLEDYETGRDEIKVWCGGCWDGSVKHWTLFECGEEENKYEMVIGYLTPNALWFREGNHPNTTWLQVVSSSEGFSDYINKNI